MSRQAKTYKVIELDANDKELVLRSGISRAEAIAMLGRLRNTYKDILGIRYVMYHDRVADPNAGFISDEAWSS
jgi:hypothetical protein